MAGAKDPFVLQARSRFFFSNVNVTVGECRKEASQTAPTDKKSGEILVVGVAVAIVGEDRAAELVQEDCTGGKELDEVAKPR